MEDWKLKRKIDTSDYRKGVYPAPNTTIVVTCCWKHPDECVCGK